MATSSNHSLGELERRAELNRAELAQTVDALHDRVSPRAIKADVRNYLRDNPLQAAVLAIGAAYPVWRMISAMPAPVLLIGAGLAMSRRTGTSFMPPQGDGVVTAVKDKASDIGSQLAGKAQDTMESVRSMASDTVERASETLSDTYESGRQAASDTLHKVSERAGEGYARASEQFAQVIDRHPLVIGGIALAAGSLIASAVPVSRPERRLMGEAAGAVRQRSQELARHGLDEAGTVARQVYDTARDEIGRDGLTPEAARRTARAAVDTARDAMENAAASGSRS